MSKVKAWIHAFRLRTLPLSLSGIILGSLLAAAHQIFSWTIFILAVFTTLFLQILSNLANDLGDSIKGSDNANRIGPERAVQSGSITKQAMKRMVGAFVVFSLITGAWLVYESIKQIGWESGIVMLLLGLIAVGAAINYTVGHKPYGYRGFGDLFVFIFFGIIGVSGVYFLHTGEISIDLFLPAASLGFLSVGVLNLNNMRDRDNDAQTGKRTLVVMMGEKKARIYHTSLLLAALCSALIYTIINWNSLWQLIYLISFPLFWLNLKVVLKHENPAHLDPELKKLALSTFLFALTFGFGMLL